MSDQAVGPRNDTNFDFCDARVLVTGGTSGIGCGIARAFADAGAAVSITGTRPRRSDYETDLGDFAYISMRAEDEQSVDAAIDAVLAQGVLDVLVNNAGVNLPGGRDEWQPDVFAQTLAMNLTGTFRLTVGCEGALRASRLPAGASVVNIVSMAAQRAVPIVPAYGSAKAGLAQLTRNLAVHWASAGIRVNAVAPGVVRTPMTAPMSAMPELEAAELARVPMGRFAEVSEIVPAVLFLSSVQASYMTGQIMAVDGGYLAI